VLNFRYDFELSIKLTILDRALIDQGSKDNEDADSYEQDSIDELKLGLQIPAPFPLHPQIIAINDT
jgi:hypothetical protein